MLRRYYMGIMLLVFTSGCAKEQMSESDVRAGLAQRFDAMRNVMVVYDVNDSLDDRIAVRLASLLEERLKHTAGGAVSIEGGHRCKRFCRLGEMLRYESRVCGQTPDLSPAAEEVYEIDDTSSRLTIVAGGLTKSLEGYDNDTRFTGMITALTPQEPYAIDEPWGLRWANHLLTDGLPQQCKITVTGNKVELRIQGVGGWSSRLMLDPEMGYAPVIQEAFDGDGRVLERTLMKDWRQVGGVWVAYRIERTAFIAEANITQAPFDKAVFTVKSCRINSTDNTPSLYKMVWPEGTELIDRGGF